MNVKLIAHTALSHEFHRVLLEDYYERLADTFPYNDRAAVALTAIRTCYSANKPSEIVALEGERYFGQSAKDGAEGTEADRLIRQIVASKHTSTLEHVTYTFAIECVSRSLLAQLTRHRVGFSFSVQSQRYVRFGSGDKSGGFDYVTPLSVTVDKKTQSNDGEDFYVECSAKDLFEEAMRDAQYAYDRLRKAGVPPEDARMVLPNAAACNLVMTANLRALLDFYEKRKHGKGAQHEIADLAERIREEIVKVDPWTEKFFERK